MLTGDLSQWMEDNGMFPEAFMSMNADSQNAVLKAYNNFCERRDAYYEEEHYKQMRAAEYENA